MLVVTTFAEVKKENRTARVEIIAVDDRGESVGDDFNVDSFQPQFGGPDLAGRFRKGVASKILYGTYRARVHLTGWLTAERTVEVSQPEVFVVIGMELGLEGGPTREVLTGSVKTDDKSPGPILVRIAGVFSAYIFDAQANSTGEFSLDGVPMGEYVAVATRGSKILGSTAFTLGLNPSPVIISGVAGGINSK